MSGVITVTDEGDGMVMAIAMGDEIREPMVDNNESLTSHIRPQIIILATRMWPLLLSLKMV